MGNAAYIQLYILYGMESGIYCFNHYLNIDRLYDVDNNGERAKKEKKKDVSYHLTDN